ncbi:MAG: group II intron reverse transcriptase/maturase [Verrucomicrobia bacterium]|nr:MAG: group II intron reverse transcriptase/maturase [Verrucomicrobiota bacterium]
MMNERGKSDGFVVPKTPANNTDKQMLESSHQPMSIAEQVEGRRSAEGNLVRCAKGRTQSRDTLQAALDRIRQAAGRDSELRLSALWHHVYNVDRLREEFYRLKPTAAAGVDGQTWHGYGEALESNLQDLSSRLKRGSYRARPVRRVMIPKADGRERPIGIPTLEDKVVQRSAATVLGALYEVDFMGFSYGFRPGRSAHDALDALSVGLVRRKINWVLDADISGFFDAIDHESLVKFIEHRVADRRVIRHVKKWLRAGVLEDGKRTLSQSGTPQGGSISPLLANIYLHYVFDLWVHQWRQRQTNGDVIVVRYADDFVVGFQHRSEAESFQKVLRQRLGKFNLKLHPEKTRLMEFGRFAGSNRKRDGQSKPETFDFLGFTHACSKSRRGSFVVLRFPISKRVRAKLSDIKAGLKYRMHQPVAETGRWLQSVVGGWLRYYAVPRSFRWLQSFRNRVMRLWWWNLRRRGDKRKTTWSQIYRLSARWLPLPRIIHPYPEQRLSVKTQSRSPVR